MELSLFYTRGTMELRLFYTRGYRNNQERQLPRVQE